MEKSNEQIAIQIARNCIIVNSLLATFKLFAGAFARSAAMVADAVHSMSDVFSTFIALVGVKLANQKTDKEHPYGHERFECVAAIVLAVILFLTGCGIGWSGVQKILAGNYGEIAVPGFLALVAAFVSIVVQETMYWYTSIGAKKIDSCALMAAAWHHRSDAFSSVGSFAGILGARLGFPILDPITSVVICLFILKVAFDIFRDAVGKMTDKACDAQMVDEIGNAILAQELVDGIDQLNTRLFGNKIYVDTEIRVNASITLKEAHVVAQIVHDTIENQFPKVKHCMVHVNPTEEQLSLDKPILDIRGANL
jgi:cation diffusion facilitator family transporter